MIEFNKAKARKIYRKDMYEQRNVVKLVKSNKGRTTKVHVINTERKRILRQRREKVLQNAKDRKIGKVNAQIALQASTRATKASKDTQDIKMADNDTTGKDSTVTWQLPVDVHLPPHSSGKAKHPSQIKTSSKHTTAIADPSICTVLIPVSLVVHVVRFYAALLHLIALGNIVRVYPGIVQGLTFYLYKDE